MISSRTHTGSYKPDRTKNASSEDAGAVREGPMGAKLGALSNQDIAARLREAADLLSYQGANPFRVGAYRRAADTIVTLEEDVGQLIHREGFAGLEALPNIGQSLALAIDQLSMTGRWAQLDRLRGALEPEQVFQSIPGIGAKLARRIHQALDVETLEALEVAAHDGRLETVPGISTRRATAIRAILANMLARGRQRRRTGTTPVPTVDLLLDVDREYRQKVTADALQKIAPRRFNPSGAAWLPIMHAQRDEWHFTALYSNTARAHRFGRTRDWVVLYFHTDDSQEGQCTVVTETRGELEGRRVVRGREVECRKYYADHASQQGGNAPAQQG